MAIPVYLWLKDDGGADIKDASFEKYNHLEQVELRYEKNHLGLQRRQHHSFRFLERTHHSIRLWRADPFCPPFFCSAQRLSDGRFAEQSHNLSA